MADMVAKGRQAKPSGERNHNSILTEEDVRQIRVLHSLKIRAAWIAAAFGVSKQTISFAATRRTWKEVA